MLKILRICSRRQVESSGLAVQCLLRISIQKRQAALNWRRGGQGQREFHEIRTYQRTLDEIIALCEQANLSATVVLEPRFGDPERLIFEKNGKQEYFHRIKGLPPIYILHVRAPKKPAAHSLLKNTRSTITSLRGARFALGPSDSFVGEMQLSNSCIDQL